MNTDTDRAIALAGVFQSAALARQIARHGSVDNEPFSSTLESVLVTDPEDSLTIFGGTANGVRLGLKMTMNYLSGQGSKDMDLTRNVVTLLQLGQRLYRDEGRLNQISEGIESIKEKLEHYPIIHENQVAALADLYEKNVSTLTPRIMVRGEPLHLQNPANQNRIRAVLLGGIRAAVLWVQCGGSRWKLLLGRGGLASAAKSILDA
jgi:high frequency lysogenization protein